MNNVAGGRLPVRTHGQPKRPRRMLGGGLQKADQDQDRVVAKMDRKAGFRSRSSVFVADGLDRHRNRRPARGRPGVGTWRMSRCSDLVR